MLHTMIIVVIPDFGHFRVGVSRLHTSFVIRDAKTDGALLVCRSCLGSWKFHRGFFFQKKLKKLVLIPSEVQILQSLLPSSGTASSLGQPPLYNMVLLYYDRGVWDGFLVRYISPSPKENCGQSFSLDICKRAVKDRQIDPQKTRSAVAFLFCFRDFALTLCTFLCCAVCPFHGRRRKKTV